MPHRKHSLAFAASLALTLCVASTACAQKKYALLVGVDRYPNHPDLARLKYAEDDAEGLLDALTKGKSNFDKNDVVVLTQSRGKTKRDLLPTADNFRAQLKKLTGKMTDDDVLLIAFSGHGMRVTLDNKDEENFLCTQDAYPARKGLADLDTLSRGMIPLGGLLKQLGRVKGTKLLLVDACRQEYEPRGISRSLRPNDQQRPPKGVAVLFACKNDERSFQSGKLGRGLFAHFVIEALKKARNADREVTWALMADYVPKNVAAFAASLGDGAAQTPQQISRLEGGSPVLVVAEGKTSEDDVHRQAMALYTGMGDRFDPAKARKLFAAAAAKGHSLSKATLAWMIYNGLGSDEEATDEDRERAKKLVAEALPAVQRLAKDGDVDAQVRLAALFSIGLGVKKDVKESVRLCKLAAAKKDPGALNNLAVAYESGAATGKPDLAKAIELYTEAAELGHAFAIRKLITHHQFGKEKDSKELFFRWARKAAEKGDVVMMYYVGACYRAGSGVKRDKEEAFNWFRDGAERGNVMCMNDLARAYEIGEGTDANEKKAFEWYKKAADEGSIMGMINLARCYHDGVGLPKENKTKAIEWYKKATEQKPTNEADKMAQKYAQEQLKKLTDA
jgi:TPR repeat protein